MLLHVVPRKQSIAVLLELKGSGLGHLVGNSGGTNLAPGIEVKPVSFRNGRG
jgi:hypothetical protein